MEKLRSKDKVSKVERDAANAVVNESLKHYVKAMIPHINEKKMAEKIIKYYKDEYQGKVLKVPPARRKLNTNCINLLIQLNDTFPFYPNNAEDILEKSKKGKSHIEVQAINEELMFLASMRTDRAATYGAVNVKATSLLQRRLNHEKTTAISKTSRVSNKNMEVSSSQDNSFEEDSSEATEEDNMDNDERSKRDHKRMVKTGTPGFWPHDIKVTQLLFSATRYLLLL